jgi:hypothetical protein
MKRQLQNEWASDSAAFTTTTHLARWAIDKENKLTTVKHIQAPKGRYKETPRTETPRNTKGTFRPNAQAPRGDPTDLDATRRRAPIPISQNEYRRRMTERLCLRCGRQGHRAAECRSTANNRWTTKTKVQEINLEEEAAKDGGPQ